MQESYHKKLRCRQERRYNSMSWHERHDDDCDCFYENEINCGKIPRILLLLLDYWCPKTATKTRHLG